MSTESPENKAQRTQTRKRKKVLGETNIVCKGCGKFVGRFYMSSERGDFCSTKCYYGDRV